MDDLRTERKRDTLLDFLSRGVVLVYVDSTREGVALPRSLMDQPQVQLHLSYTFDNEVFTIDELGVRVSLTTQELKMVCMITWESVYFLQRLDVDGVGVSPGEVFIESVPHELLERYGLTMRVARDLPIQPNDEESSPLPWALTDTPDLGQRPGTLLSEDEVHSESASAPQAVSAWVQSLERLDDDPIEESEGPLDARSPASEEPQQRDELSFSRIFDLISTVEDVVSSASRRVRRGSSTHRSKRARDLKEGEHDPERGIFSLARMRRESKSR